MTSSRKKRIALFVESHEGYGHFNIVSQLARRLQEEGAEVMVLSGTLNYAGASQTFNFKNARIVHLPLVDYKIIKGGKWEYFTPEGAGYDDSPEYKARRQAVVREALEDFKPDAVVAELYPFQQSFRTHDMDVVDELAKDSKKKPIRLTLCRDIIHNSKPHKVIEQLNNHFDRILVRGDARFSNLGDSQAEWKNIKMPIEYMGNFITPMPNKEKMPDDERHVVVFSGGGYYEKDLRFLEGIIKSRALSEKFHDRIWDIYVSENTKKHIIPDPQDSGKTINAHDYLVRLANEQGHGSIRISEPIDSKKFRKKLANAAIAITRGGYNTTFELYAARTPQLVVPRQTEEQILRANTLYKHGMAQIFPEYPIEDSKDITNALKDIPSMAKAIDLCPEISASTPPLNNHGAETTAQRIIGLIKERDMPSLNLLIVYEDNKLKRHDADQIARHLQARGHVVTLVDAARATVKSTAAGRVLEYENQLIPLSSFDGATLRSPTEIPGTKMLADAIRAEKVPIYQDYPMLEVAADKLLSHHQFQQHKVPTPLTSGYHHNQIPMPGKVEAIADQFGQGPYVVKASRGWSGKQVKVVDTKDEAVAAFKEFHRQAQIAQEGGALMQQFIDSDPDRRFDYRIQTVTGVSDEGELNVDIVAAAKRKAQPGNRVTNVSLGADKIRVSLSEDEAYHFYVEKKGMEEEVFYEKLANGEIEVLSPKLAKAATKAALAFGSGSLGVDIVVDQATGAAHVIEVNPFAGGSKNFEEVHGFTIYKEWADSFAEHVLHEKNITLPDKDNYWATRSKIKKAGGGAQHSASSVA